MDKDIDMDIEYGCRMVDAAFPSIFCSVSRGRSYSNSVADTGLTLADLKRRPLQTTVGFQGHLFRSI